MARVEVDAVGSRLGRRRFAELPYALYRDEPRWIGPPLARVERKRFKRRPRANPFFEAGDAELFVARLRGRSAGRVSAHVRHDGDEGWFGFFECVDDQETATALLDAAAEWLVDRGCTTMTGPASFVVEEQGGVLVRGRQDDCVTGRPWTPAFFPTLFERAGLRRHVDIEHWHLATPEGMCPGDEQYEGVSEDAHEVATQRRLPLPLHLRQFADPRLLLAIEGVGHVSAIPDLAGPARGLSPAAGSVAVARHRRDRTFPTAVILEVDGPHERLIPPLLRAAGAAGYASVVSPWSPTSRRADLTHRVYRRAIESTRPSL